MSWLKSRKQDVEAAVLGYIIGQEAHKQGIEDEMDWSTIEAIAQEHGIDVTDSRRAILDKTIDLGYLVKDRIG